MDEALRKRIFVIALSFFVVVLIVAVAYFIQEQKATIFSLEAKVSFLESKQFQAQKGSALIDLRLGSVEEGLGNHVTTFNSRLSRFDVRLSRQETSFNDINYRLEEVASDVGSLTDKFLSSDVRAQVDLGDITVGKK